MLGQVSSCCYFVERGRVNIIWKTDSKQAPRFVVRSDYFGELGLFQNKQHLYSARAMTHCDTYSLTRADFEEVMCHHPAVAVQIADMLTDILSKPAAKEAVQSIYNMVGISSLLGIFSQGKWRPLRGLAQRIKNLAENEEFMRRMRAIAQPHASTPRRQSREGRASKDSPTSESGRHGLAPEWPPVGAPDASPPDADPVVEMTEMSPAGGRSLAPIELPPSPMSLQKLTQAHTTLTKRVQEMASAQQRVEKLLGAIATKLGVSEDAGGGAVGAQGGALGVSEA